MLPMPSMTKLVLIWFPGKFAILDPLNHNSILLTVPLAPLPVAMTGTQGWVLQLFDAGSQTLTPAVPGAAQGPSGICAGTIVTGYGADLA
jgi:hypothetical protein